MIDLDCLDGICISTDTHESYAPASSIKSVPQNDENLLTCMLITANVGTIFEESTLLQLWFQQLESYLIRVRPQMVAIHCQEVGGKNFENSMKHVSNFTDKITGDDFITGEYNRIRIFLDENFENLEKFTALGSLYLIHNSVRDVKLYNFKTAKFDSVEGTTIFADKSRQETEHVEKVKFPQELFPECRWSRKGFMRTRWLFNDEQPLDLVNIHLFHDASNLVAMETSPSPYAQNRQRALEYALDKLSIDDKNIPLFIFGDFNFRLDTSKVIQHITSGLDPIVKKSADSNEVLEISYHRRGPDHSDINPERKGPHVEDQSNDGNSNYIEGNNQVVMTVGKKLFDCQNLDETFRGGKNTEWLLKLDNELDSFKSQLCEFKISFSPSYPFKEDESGGHSYMKTRCPAWCDRILFNAAGRRLIYCGDTSNNSVSDNDISSQPDQDDHKLDRLQERGEVFYRLMGSSVPMGDHKPVLLYCKLNLSSSAADSRA